MSTSKNLLRAFELQPAVERVPLDEGDKVTCLELTGEILFIGTQNGHLLQYHWEEIQPAARDQSLKTKFKVSLLAKADLGPKAPVTFVRSASALNRLLVLCDGVLFVMNMHDLSVLNLNGSSKFKGMVSCCVNENPYNDNPFSVQICVAKKKQIVVCSITEEQFAVEKICDLGDQVTKVSMDGVFVCAALVSHYVIYNVQSGNKQELFPVEGTPVVARVSKEEFLLSAPGGLGMFVTSQGLSERPPIQWSKTTYQFVQCPPYIIALTRDGIFVHSIIDQQQKQFLHFLGGESLGNYDGKLLVASVNSVYSMQPIPIEIQIKNLLDNGNVEEALELAENFQHRGRNSRFQFEKVLHEVRSKAGFICLKNMQLEKAMDLFLKGDLDPRELISLFPRLLPSATSFTRAVPTLHDFADITSITKGDIEMKQKVIKFLVDFLETLRNSQSHQHLLEIDTALIKVYSEHSPEKLEILLNRPDLNCDLNDTKKCLEQFKLNHFLSLFNFRRNFYDQSLSLWAAMLKGSLNDKFFPGLDFFISKLMSSPEELLWRYADFVLEKDEMKGVELFRQKFDSDQVEKQDRVLNVIKKYSKGHLYYLEDLVLNKKSQIGKFHDNLANCYFDLANQSHSDQELRKKFQTFILESKFVNCKTLITKVEATDMNQEKAILYGKMGNHDKALKIFVVDLNEPKSAENYCDQISKEKGTNYKQELLLSLMKIYLSEDQQNPLLAMDLFNRRSGDFKAPDLLQILPDHWSVSSTIPGLKNMISKSTHLSRETLIMKGLAKSENINVHYEKLIRTKLPIEINESSYCMACQKQFHSAEFSRYPNGIIVHTECATERNICPVTGKMF